MSAILAGFGINTSGSPRRLAQRDTEAYWRRLLALGGTDINANDEVQNVQEFLAGVYGIGARGGWNVWTLRSGQNVGTGALVDPIIGGGGLGTLVNGPTWGVDGISYVQASIHRLITGIAVPSADVSSFVVASPSAAADQARILMGNRTASAGAHSFENVILNGNYTAIHHGVFNISSSNGVFQFFAMGNKLDGVNATAKGSINLGAFENSSTPAVATSYGTSLLQIGSSNYSTLRGFNGDIAFVCVRDGDSALSDRDTLYSLYKSTLGQGLGLP